MIRSGQRYVGLVAITVISAAGLLAADPPAAPAAPPADQPLRIIERPRLDFPRKLLGAGITTGEVRLYLDVDVEGRLADHLIVAYTHYEFANVVSKTVGRWRFEPAIVGGRPLASTVSFSLKFEGGGVMIAERREAEEPPAIKSEFTFRARGINELDAPPKPVVTVAPVNPAAAGLPAVTGRARVEFYIDENGNVRMPTVAAADDERLGWVAVIAIAKWKFEVPRRAGRAVLARASQIFVFRPDE